MIRVISLDMIIMIIVTTIVDLGITIGITGIEISALDITIMGMTGQIEHLTHNGKVNARIKAVTKVMTTITVCMVMVRINTISMVERDRTGLIVNMPTTLNRITIIDVNSSHLVGTVRIKDQVSLLNLLFWWS